MSSIQEILAQNLVDRLDEPVPGDEQLTKAETALRVSLPAEYREFVRCGGLNDLRFKNRILGPAEIVQNARYLHGGDHVPFASNGCGDLYCWSQPAMQVVLWDH